MTVIKRERSDTKKDLVEALKKFIDLLRGQKEEEEAVEVLTECQDILSQVDVDPSVQVETLKKIVDAFEGDLELNAYTFQRDGNQWTEVEELSNASSRVLSLSRRMLR